MTTINDQIEKVSLDGEELFPAYDTAGGTDRKIKLDTIKDYVKASYTSDDITEGTANLYDKVVAIEGSGSVAVAGTYPNFSISGGLATYFEGSIAGGIPSLNVTNPFTHTDMTALKARDDTDTTDIHIPAQTLAINLAADHASGIVPLLVSVGIYIWADGTRYYFDDVNGSNMGAVKRLVAAIITNTSSQIVPYRATAKGGGAVFYKYTEQLTFNIDNGDSIANFTLRSPVGTNPLLTFVCSGYYSAQASPYIGVIDNGAADSQPTTVCYAHAEGNYSQTAATNTIDWFTNEQGYVRVRYRTRTNTQYEQGYILERTG